MYSCEEPYKMKALLAFDLQFASSGLESCSKRHRLYKDNLLHVTALSAETPCALFLQRHDCLLTAHRSHFATYERRDRTATSPAATFCGRTKRHSAGVIEANFRVRLRLGVYFAVNNFD